MEQLGKYTLCISQKKITILQKLNFYPCHILVAGIILDFSYD